jgi:3-dehydroquinate synthase
VNHLNIIFSDSPGKDLAALIGKKYTQVAVVVDENTRQHCYPLVKEALPPHVLIEIPSGEAHKTLDTCTQVWDSLTEDGFDRNGLLINLGGGVIGDLGGFCAATYKRGIDFMTVPTTLLAMADAGIGGKLGIDYNGLKNHIGLFQHPEAIVIHQGFLKTLSERERRSGFAEVIKHGLIADEYYWQLIRGKNFAEQPWEKHVKHSVRVKQGIVANDPLEQGERKLLNFGHTIGHAIETYRLTQSTQPLLHGEAIAIGMICESYISYTRKFISKTELKQITAFLLQIYGKESLPAEALPDIIQWMYQDKKNKDKKINATLLEKVGRGKIDVYISELEAKEAMEFYEALDIVSF